MNHLINSVIDFFSDEILRSKVLTYGYILFAGLFQVTRADFAWWLSALVGVFAVLNYVDQMVQRHKEKKKK